MHYNPSVTEAFNSVEHKVSVSLCILLCVLFLSVFLTNKVSTTRNSTKMSSLSKIKPVQSSNSRRLFCDVTKRLNSLSDEQFFEWFRGLTDGEGCFIITQDKNKFKFIFDIYLHKDDAPMLNYIALRLQVGSVNTWDHFACLRVSNQNDLRKIFSLFDLYPLNTSKNLNYLTLKKAHELYFNRKSSEKTLIEISTEIINLKNKMNKQRIDFNQPEGHKINITPYWFLGFVEAEGYFSVGTTSHRLIFGLGQTASELPVLEAIRKFLLDLPGSYKIARKDTNAVSLTLNKKAKNQNSKPMAKIEIGKTDFLTNIIVPFFDNLIWLSKKELDYKDWKLILNIKNQGKHFTDEGKELISLISQRTNRNRLSTNLTKPGEINIQERVLNLLASPSNYEIKPDGKIWIKSLGVYLKGRGNISVEALDEKGILIDSFSSIKECALFFGVSERTIIRRLDKGSFFEYNGKNLVFKREVALP